MQPSDKALSLAARIWCEPPLDARLVDTEITYAVVRLIDTLLPQPVESDQWEALRIIATSL